MAESPLPTDDYRQIAVHYERCLRQHGPTHRGVDWPNASDLATRFAVMLAAYDPPATLVQSTAASPADSLTLLDVGCGPGLLLDHLAECQQLERYRYRGLDISDLMIAEARKRWPQHQFEQRDILQEPLPDNIADLVIMNGVLTEKASLTDAAMRHFAQDLIKSAFAMARHALAFNVMSAHVDWRRDDLFHWPFDDLAQFLRAEVSRHFCLRADYGLYEYTVYLYRQPVMP